jgi:glycosyltransferase involved in cell wall biosynthesis
MSRSEDYAARLRRLAQELAPDAVHFAGFISDVECVALLQHASAFLAPSRGEGFDLPALEAMACGIPVVCSDIPVHRELLGDEVLFFSTDSADDLGAQLSALFAAPDLLHTLKRAGPKHAARFSWARSMQQLAQLYRALPAHSTLVAVAV